MGILSWFADNHAQELSSAAIANALLTGEIAYDEDLITELKRDHQGLVRILAEISGAAASERYEEIPRLLGRLKIAVQSHIMTENLEFYAFLQHKLGDDRQTAQYVEALRKEMDGVARDVVEFAEAHSSTTLTAESAGAFSHHLREIGEILLRRFEIEETELYPLYAP